MIHTADVRDVKRIAREGEDVARAVRSNFSWRLMGFPALAVGRDGIARYTDLPAYVGRGGFFSYVGMVPPQPGGNARPMRNLCVALHGESVSSPMRRAHQKSILVHAATLLGGDQPTYIFSTDKPEDRSVVRFLSIVWEMPDDFGKAPVFVSFADGSKLGPSSSKLIGG